ncbi:Aldo/keto reductase family protein [Cryobacterium levicorallinum]|uniref:Aldo/keto reductase family protein n=1 Tax=Cryobacterium levicorallinum TaxID=995038 RepID=A0ABY1EGY7_9MICO|nr:Aldo/keto reductase family protein [Cryobacterium levicorallinum]
MRAAFRRSRHVFRRRTGKRRHPVQGRPSIGLLDFSKGHILRSVDESLAALKTVYLDLLLHRPDALMEQDEVAEAFKILHDAGKVLNFGVSNHTPGQVELLKHSVAQPLIVNQVQLSITHAPLITAGVSAVGSHITLTRGEWYRLFTATGHILP